MTNAFDELAPPDVRRPRRAAHGILGRRAAGIESGAVWIIALSSALGAAAAHTHPTATAGSDVVAALCLGAVVVAASALAGPWAWLAASLIAAAAASGAWVGVAGAAVTLGVVAVISSDLPNRRVIGAIIGAAVVQTLLRLPSGRFGLNALLSALAIGCLVVAGWPLVSDPTRARLRRLSIMVGGLAALAVAGLMVSILLARNDVGVGISRGQDGLAAARMGNSDHAADLLEDARRAFRSAHDDLGAWWAKPALLLPIVGQHARGLVVVSDAGSDLAHAAATSARTARVQDLRLTQGRLDLDRVRSMAAPLATVRTALSRADEAVARAESQWLVPPVANRLGEFERSVEAAASDAAAASEAVAVLPDVLGGSGRRFYFVAFGTPAETRDLGGFMGAYAILLADDGKLSLATTGRVMVLNELLRGKQLEDPSAFPDHYRALQPQKFWQNVTGTADFPTVAEAVRQLWPERALGHLDGVLYMDPETLAALLELTGPIRVPDYDKPLTADTAAPFLLREQYIAFPDDDRHDFLVDAAKTVFRKLTSGDLPAPRIIADTLAPAVHERRLLLNSFHPAEQALFERLQLDGALPPVRGDFLSVRASNRGLSKIDTMMQRTVAYDVTVDPTRNAVHATVTVTIRNEAPASGLPYNVIGNHLGEPSGTNSTTISVYTPLELVDVTQGGRSIGRGAYPEYDRFKYTALLDVPAGREVTVMFELEGPMDVRAGYHLDVVPQPLVNPDQLRVNVEGPAGWLRHGDETLVTELREPEQLDVSFFSLHPMWPL